MRFHRGVGRTVSFVLGGAVVLGGLAGCARTNENIVELLEQESGVTVVELVGGSGPKHYEITLDADIAPADVPEVAARLNDVTDSAVDDRWTFAVRSGAWEWRLGGDDEQVSDLAAAMAALDEVDGVYSGRGAVGENGLYVEAVAETGVDPVALVSPLTEAAAAGPIGGKPQLVLSDLQERKTIETRDPAALQPAFETVEAVASAGAIQTYSLKDDELTLRMRTEADAAAARTVVDAFIATEPGLKVALSAGILTTTGRDADADARIGEILAPIDGVVSARVETRSPQIDILMITTADAETALAVQQTLTASPALLEPYRSLQFAVQQEVEPGVRVKALSTNATGYVGSLEPALELAAAEGVHAVTLTPNTMDVVIEHDVDMVALVPAIKSVAVREQEAEIFGSTLWGPNLEHAAYSFDVLGKLHANLVNGYGDEQEEFVTAWNDAPGV